MKRIKIIVLCEDKQHAVFALRFLKKRKLQGYANFPPESGKGSGEQFVRENYPKYLDATRNRNGQLAVMTDGNTIGASERMKQLDNACKAQNIEPRKPADKAVVFIPTRNIETWLAYLDGEAVDETQPYPRLAKERECKRHVNVLAKMCDVGALRTPAPPSLLEACKEYQKLR